ncbi:DIS3-like exonuclease 2 [Cucurbita pepo subsp. pepo]|uniref:DIS3-like exonuclease 2 n=1 Tax=Cucurbita pepo subsp. pepo TaxID=3664 RepID=UPI000C9D65F9|nr:DIS3-like exonuclease 2 [Cucurbita pepo subsp. pepo]
MRGSVEQSTSERNEDGGKEWKKKDRSNWRSEQKASIWRAVSCSSVNEIPREASECMENCRIDANLTEPSFYSSLTQDECQSNQPTEPGFTGRNKLSFSSLSPLHIGQQAEWSQNLRNQHHSMDTGRWAITSCPEQIASGSMPWISMNQHSPPADVNSQRKYFTSHWPLDDVNRGLQKGDIFKALFRMNAHYRVEAYCKIDGIPVDVLIYGSASQNRAVEGDIVAMKMNPFSLWSRMKGTSEAHDNMHSLEDANVMSDSFWSSPSVDPIGRICAVIDLFPTKRPTGKVVAILKKSRQRGTIVGLLNVKKFLSFHDCGYVQLMPNDARFPTMMVFAVDLPDCIKKRLDNGDATVESELVAARIDEWLEESSAPKALVMHVLGRGSRIESHIDAILFQNAILTCEFSRDSLSCLPHTPWKIPQEELQCRRDLRNLCIFTIDPPSALDLDDAFSVQKLANGIFRVGIHVADVSHFVLPDTALDKEARIRSTSVHLLRRKIPMLPPLLSENIGSLNPGVDRLAFSLFLDINHCGDVEDCWIGRTVICSCCKLSYGHAQDIIDSSKVLGHCVPQLHGQSTWLDIISSVRTLNEISKTLKEKRFRDGALRIENPKIVFLYDEFGIPYDSTFHERKDSNFLVEEFVLLANRTVAEVISRTFPDRALLRRHPKPIFKKLTEFESFCSKQGFELDTSSSFLFQQSLEQIRMKFHDDPLLFDAVISYATRSTQLASYFCNGELKDGENGSYYSLAVPWYTHFTSPLRRYADIVVHRTLAAAVEAEELYLKHQSDERMRCFTGMYFDKDAADSLEGREALSSAALRHGVPCSKLLSDVAVQCNNRKLASKHAADACDKLYMWALLKEKQILFSDAKVLGLGSKFMTLYIQKLAIERRIYYEEVKDLANEWLDATSTLVLSFPDTRRSHGSRDSIKWKALEDVALVISPCDLTVQQSTLEGEASTEGAAASDSGIIEPAVFPLTVQLLSTLPVALHAVGGDDGAIEIGVRLYMSSYLR